VVGTVIWSNLEKKRAINLTLAFGDLFIYPCMDLLILVNPRQPLKVRNL